MSANVLREQTVPALMSRDVELGFVRKNPQNGEMEILVLSNN